MQYIMVLNYKTVLIETYMYSPVQYHIYSNYVVLDYMYVKYGVGFKHMKSIHVYGTKLQYCADRYYTLALV